MSRLTLHAYCISEVDQRTIEPGLRMISTYWTAPRAGQ